ncbi:MAG: Sigma factor AlgU negative regulatory protein [Gammaproteobacteria bacterium]|nr:Sigma factor AlgU negative regulatory protein [Gammaproteobacteria bacterium]
MSENLSALIDNELDEFERARVLKALGCDEHLAGLWSRYHIIGLAMRQETIGSKQDLPERVARQLERDEDLAGGARESKPDKSRFWLSGRYAVAASVVGVLLLGGLILKIYDAAQVGTSTSPAARQVAVIDNATRWEGVDPKVEDELNALLVEHGEFTSASGMNGLTAYAKFVAYDSP